jgi:hypothetical protein
MHRRVNSRGVWVLHFEKHDVFVFRFGMPGQSQFVLQFFLQGLAISLRERGNEIVFFFRLTVRENNPRLRPIISGPDKVDDRLPDSDTLRVPVVGAAAVLKIPPSGKRVGRILTSGDSLSTVLELIFGCRQALSRVYAFWICLTVIAAVPAASSTTAAAMIAVFTFDHAISFNVPLMRVTVEVEVAAQIYESRENVNSLYPR